MESCSRLVTRISPFLVPKSSYLTRVAKKHRGPPRYFGKTKSQLLDGFMRANALTWSSVVLLSMPLLAYMIHRYRTVVMPAKKLEQERVHNELLSEGKFEGQ